VLVQAILIIVLIVVQDQILHHVAMVIQEIVMLMPVAGGVLRYLVVHVPKEVVPL